MQVCRGGTLQFMFGHQRMPQRLLFLWLLWLPLFLLPAFCEPASMASSKLKVSWKRNQRLNQISLIQEKAIWIA